MELMKKVVLKLTPEEKKTILDLQDMLISYCLSGDFPQCVGCPFDRNNNGRCIKAQFFNTLNKLID